MDRSPKRIQGEKEFQWALHIILNLEGGVSHHPADRGGLTNLGVTQGTYDLYLKSKGLPAADVREISRETATEVYRSMFWEPAACPFLTWRLGLLHFDTAVQRGAVKANRMLQQIIGVKPDGMIGPQTLQVIAIAEEESILRNYLRDRERHYEQRVAEAPDQAVFLAGWRNRLAHLAKELNLA